jgi:Tol biopolymer transport system component
LIAHIHSVSPNASFVELADIKQNSYWRLTSFSWEYLRCLKWLRDGSGLIAVGKQNNSVYNQLWFISYPSGEVRRISWDLNDYAFSTSVSDDGSILALSGVTQSNIWLGQADDLGRSRQVTFDANGRNAGWWGLAWTPQDQILYAANIGEGTSIFTMNTDGSEQRQLIPTGAINNYPSVTADGKTLVFQSNRGGHFAVWKANIDGSNMKQISGDSVAGQPSVSPDGKWVVYTSHVENTGDLWRIPLGGGDPSLLAKGAGWSAVSPDSRFVACLLTKPKESLSILSIDDGSVISSFEVPKLANLRLGVRWSPDGKSIAYRDWTNGIWLQPVSGGEPRRLEGIPEEKLFAFGWSADGKQFAYTRGSTLQDIVLITPEK